MTIVYNIYTYVIVICPKCVLTEERMIKERERQDSGAVDLSSGVREGDVLRLQNVSLQQHYTEPPQHLTESELLALMDQHGIGD